MRKLLAGLALVYGIGVPCLVARAMEQASTDVRSGPAGSPESSGKERFVPGSRGRTTIAHRGRDGRVLVLATGTVDGECSVFGGRMMCRDDQGYAIADAEDGCRRSTGGASCTIQDAAPEKAGALDPYRPEEVETNESSIDVECESGDRDGGVYTLRDGDGSGSCSPTYNVRGRVNGGVCTKRGSECTSFDCDHGCTGGNTNCQCHVKREPKKPRVAPAD